MKSERTYISKLWQNRDFSVWVCGLAKHAVQLSAWSMTSNTVDFAYLLGLNSVSFKFFGDWLYINVLIKLVSWVITLLILYIIQVKVHYYIGSK